MDNSREISLMRHTIELAAENVSSGRGGPFAAIVVRGDEIIAEGVNLVTSTNDPTAHAEVVAIRRACRAVGSFQLTDCELYTSCEPCPMCLGAIYWARPRRIYYAASRTDAADVGFDDAYIYEELERDSEMRRLPTIRLLADESQRPFQIWLDKQDRISY